MNEQPQDNNKKIIAIVGLLVIVAAIAIGVMMSSQKTDTSNQATSSPTPSISASVTPSPTSNSSNPSSGYKDGTYSATGTYQSPGGRESIDISVTIKDGAVADTTAVSGSANPTGRNYQGQFINGYKAQILGKSIDDVSISRVSGSSLTSKGFNSALEQIKSKAKG